MKTIVSFIFESMTEIDELYHGMSYYGEGSLNAVEADPETREVAFRHWERVFCYELYHKVKSKIEREIEEKRDVKYWQNITFTAELQKQELSEMKLSLLDLQQLEHRYIPDFLFHRIDNADNQELIVEVKTKVNLDYASIKGDLVKIHEFLVRYRYKNGLFILDNNSMEYVIRLLREHIEDLSFLEAFGERITILCYKFQDKKVETCKISMIFQGQGGK